MRRLAIACTLLLIPSCSTTSKTEYLAFQSPEKPSAKANKLLSEAEIAADLDLVRSALNTAYAGKEILPRDQFKKIFSKLKEIRGVRLAQNLCAEMADTLAEIPDSQLRFEFLGKRCNTKPALKAGEVGPNSFMSRKAQGFWNVRLEPRGSYLMAMISLIKMPKRQDPGWKGFLAAVEKAATKGTAVALDLRGLESGDVAIGYELAKLLNGTIPKMPYAKLRTNESTEAHQLRLNVVEREINKLHRKKMVVSKSLLASRTSLAALRDAAILERKEYSETPWEGEEFDPAKSAKKPIYILVDSRCAGVCELVVQAFEYNPYAKVVGENTAGDVTFGKPGALNLKNSGIWALIPTSYKTYRDNRFIEKVGITPKIPAPKGSEALFYLGH